MKVASAAVVQVVVMKYEGQFTLLMVCRMR